ncbi:MAG: baseplate J/gp47 family protein [Shewanella oncorhynchi]
MTLTSSGFTRSRLAEIKADFDASFSEALGAVNTAPDAVVGQVIGILSAAFDDAYENLQNVYDAMYPYSAEGTSLDGSVAFVGLSRNNATATVVTAVCYGVESTLIPSGALARTSNNDQFATEADSIISRSNAVDAHIKITTIANSATYQIIAGGVSVVYTSDSTATAEEIASGLALLFNPLNFIATSSGDVLRIRSANQTSDFVITNDSKMTIVKLGSPVVFKALSLGAVICPVGALTRIDSPLAGWDEVSNLTAGAVGRSVETDEGLRDRHANAISVTGSATVNAIRSRLLGEVDSVTKVSIYENRTSTTNSEGLPPHSFESVIVGGDSQSIANKLWEVKPAGIETYGNLSVEVTDENGDVQIIKFTRSSEKYAWIRVSVTLLYPEEPLTQSASSAIQSAVKKFGDSLGGGDDLILQRFIGPIYEATTGIGSIVIEGAITNLPTDLPIYSTNNISVGRSNYANFDELRIRVVGL